MSVIISDSIRCVYSVYTVEPPNNEHSEDRPQVQVILISEDTECTCMIQWVGASSLSVYGGYQLLRVSIIRGSTVDARVLIQA